MFTKIYEAVKKFIKENGLLLLALAFILAITFIKLPYDVEMPGGLINLNDRVKIDGEAPELEGSFNMAYVTVSSGSIPYILIGLINPNWDVVPQSETKYDNETIEDVQKRDKLYLEQSKNYAKIAAMNEAGIEYTIENEENNIIYISEDANTDLKIGDNILSIDDTEIDSMKKIKEIIQNKDEGEEIEIKVLRDKKEKNCKAKVFIKDDEKYIGISAVTLMNIKSDKNIEIKTKDSESGPSGGMMMALMIYNALTNQDLTHGKKIVGTGTINRDGEVGKIGGIEHKVMGAAKNKADLIIVPEENYADAVATKEKKNYDIEIISVKTLKDAIKYLEEME